METRESVSLGQLYAEHPNRSSRALTLAVESLFAARAVRTSLRCSRRVPQHK
jgi:hypothetical protein